MREWSFITDRVAGKARPAQGQGAQEGSGFRPKPAWVLAALALPLWASPAFCAPKVRFSTETVRVEFSTRDKLRIAADFRKPAPGAPTVVMLHGLGAGRGEWGRFIALTGPKGWGALALDARGHGESGGPRYTTFRTTAQWLSIERDIEAALAFLKKKGIPEGRVVLAGASIGANLALRAAVRHKDVPFALLLSGGYDYQGTRLVDAAAAFDRPMLLAASKADVYALRSSEMALRIAKHRGSRLLRAESGHGVGMFDGERNAAFTKELLDTLFEMWERTQADRKRVEEKARAAEKSKGILRRDPKAPE